MTPQEKAIQKQYLTYILDMLLPHGPITAKAMFGGHGIYYGKRIVGLVVYNQLYFKIDDSTRPDFEELHSEQLIFTDKQNKKFVMPYMLVPESILENREELPLWIEKAHQVSLRSKK